MEARKASFSFRSFVDVAKKGWLGFPFDDRCPNKSTCSLTMCSGADKRQASVARCRIKGKLELPFIARKKKEVTGRVGSPLFYSIKKGTSYA